MPPQPLSRVRPKAEVYVGATGAVNHNPALSQLAGHAIAIWADIENQFGGMLATMLGANAGPAAAMFQSLTSITAQRSAVDAAAQNVLGSKSPEYDLFAIITDQAIRASKPRNIFAHWCWAYSPDLPDALLFINPEELLAYDMKAKSSRVPFEGRALTGELDRSKILVYREMDIKEAVIALDRASYHVSYIRVLLTPWLLAHDSLKDMRDQLYRTLTTEPEVAEALSRLSERRKSDPKARPSRRRK